ncbi:MAG: nucleotidyl transferase AbiEii/AbiGii toxin family protein [Phycisphaerae bacterium]|nr:nucleotidyl transferase AbiEii/AbiGii toxin family protein [Phycisphaerae bacterium]
MTSGKAHSVRQRLLNISNQKGVDYNLTLIWYALERLLYRLSRSTHSERFILKGAMLFTVWSGRTFRPTKDIDFLGYGDSSPEYLKNVFTDILQVEGNWDDGLKFVTDSLNVQPIREDQEYGGQRITVNALLGTARIRLQIDVGFGDAVTPLPEKIQFPTILKMPAPKILTYNRETVIAEKFHAINVLGLTSSRMKDYYDLWILAKQYEFNGNLLAQAIKATFERRKTQLPEELPLGLTEEFYKDEIILTRWNSFIKNTELAIVEKKLDIVIYNLQVFFGDIIIALAEQKDFAGMWDKNEWKGQPK